MTKKTGWRRRKWRKYFIGVLVATAACAAAGLVAAKFWIVPVVIRSQIRSGLGKYWVGRCEVGEIDFRYFGPTRLSRIRLLDAAGRSWLRAGSVEAVLRDWPGLHPVLTDLRVEGLELRLHFRDGRCDPPVLPFPESKPSPYVDLQRVRVRGASVAMVNATGKQVCLDGMEISVRRDGAAYQVDLAERDGTVSLAGRIDPATTMLRGELALAGVLDPSDGQVVVSCLAAPVVRRMGGRVRAQLALRGRLDGPQTPWPDGTVELIDWTLAGADGALATDVDVAISTNSTSRRAELTYLAAKAAGGTIVASGQADGAGDGAVKYNGRLTINGVRIGQLVRTITGEKHVKSGLLKARYSIAGQVPSTGGPTGRGWLLIDDAHVLDVAIFAEMFRLLGLTGLKALAKSDIEAAFTTAGAIVTLTAGQLANPLAAFEAEKGGTIDLRTTKLDLYVVAAPLNILNNVLSNVLNSVLSDMLIVNGLMRFKDTLLRLHVCGPWSDPPKKLITLRPMENLAEGTGAFFQSVLQSGGQLRGALRGKPAANENAADTKPTPKR